MKNQILYLIIASCLGLFAGCTKDNSLIQGSQNNLIQEEHGSILKSASLSAKYIVVLNDNDDITHSDLAGKKEKMKNRAYGLLKKNAIVSNPEEIYQSALQGFALKMTPGEAKKLAGDGSVKSIEADQIIFLDDNGAVISESVSKGLAKGKAKKVTTTITAPAPTNTDVTTAPAPTNTDVTTAPAPVTSDVIPWGVARVGGGINAVGKTAWIIDSGIDLTHPDLNVDVARSVSFLGETSTPNDEDGHGTHVAGIIAAIGGNNFGIVGVAAGATVVAVKVFDANNSTVSQLIAGIDYVAANGKNGDVANISTTSTISEALDNAVLNASNTSEGIKFVLCAGNQYNDVNQRSPARVNGPNVYTVSAMDNYDNFTNFSNYGNPTIDFCAPGFNITSTYKNGTFAILSGTSMSAPHVAGLLLIGAIHTDGYVLRDPDGVPDPIAHH